MAFQQPCPLALAGGQQKGSGEGHIVRVRLHSGFGLCRPVDAEPFLDLIEGRDLVKKQAQPLPGRLSDGPRAGRADPDRGDRRKAGPGWRPAR